MRWRCGPPTATTRCSGAFAEATADDVQAAVDAGLEASLSWAHTALEERAASSCVPRTCSPGLARAGQPATMLGQSKSVYQAEIGSACELIDFWRFSVNYALRLLRTSRSARRSLEPDGAAPPRGLRGGDHVFNFTSIAGNLPTRGDHGHRRGLEAAASQQLAASLIIELLEEAGLAGGVINMVTGHGGGVMDTAISHRSLAGIHSTGSTPTFDALWRRVADNLDYYRTYPRLVGETGGKDFLIAHASAFTGGAPRGPAPQRVRIPGQKCSAMSRAYVPAHDVGGSCAARWPPSARRFRWVTPSTSRSSWERSIDERAFRKHEAALRGATDDRYLHRLRAASVTRA